MRLRALVIAFVCSFPSCGYAATVQDVTDVVSLNKGNGFKKIGSGAPASPGDAVMASATGSAIIVYDNGCVQKVPAGSTVHVLTEPPCDAANLQGGADMEALVLGGLAAAAIAAGVIAVSQDGPASP